MLHFLHTCVSSDRRPGSAGRRTLHRKLRHPVATHLTMRSRDLSCSPHCSAGVCAVCGPSELEALQMRNALIPIQDNGRCVASDSIYQLGQRCLSVQIHSKRSVCPKFQPSFSSMNCAEYKPQMTNSDRGESKNNSSSGQIQRHLLEPHIQGCGPKRSGWERDSEHRGAERGVREEARG